MSIKTTSLYGSFVRYLAIGLNINCNRKIAEVIFKHYLIERSGEFFSLPDKQI